MGKLSPHLQVGNTEFIIDLIKYFTLEKQQVAHKNM